MREVGFWTPVVIGNWTLPESERAECIRRKQEDRIGEIMEIRDHAFLKDLADDYFHLPFMGNKVHVIHNAHSPNLFEVEERVEKLTVKNVLWNLLKIASIITCVVPIFLAVVKLQHRLQNNYYLLSFPEELKEFNIKGLTPKWWNEINQHERIQIYFLVSESKSNAAHFSESQGKNIDWKDLFPREDAISHKELNFQQLLKRAGRGGPCSLANNPEFQAELAQE